MTWQPHEALDVCKKFYAKYNADNVREGGGGGLSQEKMGNTRCSILSITHCTTQYSSTQESLAREVYKNV